MGEPAGNVEIFRLFDLPDLVVRRVVTFLEDDDVITFSTLSPATYRSSINHNPKRRLRTCSLKVHTENSVQFILLNYHTFTFAVTPPDEEESDDDDDCGCKEVEDVEDEEEEDVKPEIAWRILGGHWILLTRRRRLLTSPLIQIVEWAISHFQQIFDFDNKYLQLCYTDGRPINLQAYFWRLAPFRLLRIENHGAVPEITPITQEFIDFLCELSSHRVWMLLDETPTYRINTGIPWKDVYIQNPHWITLGSMLTMECRYLRLQNSRFFDTMQINEVLWRWWNGGLNKLRMLYIDQIRIHGQPNEDDNQMQIDLESFQWLHRPSTFFIDDSFVLEDVRLGETIDIRRRSDGRRASIYIPNPNIVVFMVWMD